jgi:hypothetical protein
MSFVDPNGKDPCPPSAMKEGCTSILLPEVEVVAYPEVNFAEWLGLSEFGIELSKDVYRDGGEAFERAKRVPRVPNTRVFDDITRSACRQALGVGARVASETAGLFGDGLAIGLDLKRGDYAGAAANAAVAPASAGAGVWVGRALSKSHWLVRGAAGTGVGFGLSLFAEGIISGMKPAPPGGVLEPSNLAYPDATYVQADPTNCL